MTTANNNDVTGVTIDGTDVTEITVDGTVVWPSGISSSYHLDMRGSGDNVDLSSHSITVNEGESFLFWVRPTELGSSSHTLHPGIAAVQEDSFDDWFTFGDDSGDGPHTSGTHSAELGIDDSAGTENYSPSFSLELDAWHLIGFSAGTGGVLEFYVDGSSIGTTDWGTFSGLNIGYLGPGYGGQNDDGMGGKDMDSVMKFNRELTSSEVSDFWNANSFPSPVANHWDFEEGSGSTATDVEGSSDGTINGATYVSPGAF